MNVGLISSVDLTAGSVVAELLLGTNALQRPDRLLGADRVYYLNWFFTEGCALCFESSFLFKKISCIPFLVFSVFIISCKLF